MTVQELLEHFEFDRNDNISCCAIRYNSGWEDGEGCICDLVRYGYEGYFDFVAELGECRVKSWKYCFGTNTIYVEIDYDESEVDGE